MRTVGALHCPQTRSSKAVLLAEQLLWIVRREGRIVPRSFTDETPDTNNVKARTRVPSKLAYDEKKYPLHS